MSYFIRNWKTTVVGLVVLTAQLIGAKYGVSASPDAVAAALMLLVARDPQKGANDAR